MTTYAYRAVDRDDQFKEGALEACGPEEAGRALLDQGLYPIDIHPKRSLRGILNANVTFGGASRGDVVQLMSDLGHLVNAGVEVAAALALVRTTGRPRIQSIVGRMLEQVRQGQSLSDAMQTVASLFSQDVIAVVAACEMSNTLGSGLIRIAENLRRSAALRAQVQTALIYPSCIALAMAAAITVLIAVVVPTLEGLFSDHAGRLPWQTRLLIGMSNIIRDNYLAGAVLLVVVVAAAIGLTKSLQIKMRCERILLSLPLLGDFLRSIETAQISTMLAMLAVSGVPLVEAVSLARNGTRLMISRAALDQTITQLREGRRLHESLAEVHTLNPRAIALVKIGESTGRLGSLLEEASRDSERNVAIMTERALAILPPAMTLVFGIIAGFVLYAVMTAILSVNTLATRGV